MEIKDFKKYCDDRVIKLNKDLVDVREKLKNLPRVEAIQLPTGDELNRLKFRYKTECHRSLKMRLFGISKIDLKRFLLKCQKDELIFKEKKLVKTISELKKVENITDDDVLAISGSNKRIVRAAVDFALKNNINGHELIELLLFIFRSQTSDNKEIIALLEKDAAMNFNSDGTVDSNNVKNVLFIFNKLFNMILGDKIDFYRTIVDEVYEDIKSRCPVDRDYLLDQKDAINKLKEYIDGEEIIKAADSLGEFSLLLRSAGIDDKLCSIYLVKMESVIATEEEKSNNEMVKRVLTSSEYEGYMKAKDISLNIDIPEQRTIVDRLIKDIVSICKYIDLELYGDSLTETREILSTKIHLLFEQTKIVVSPVKDASAFRYVVLEEGIPNIVRNIEMLDIINYGSIYDALVGLYAKEDNEVAFSIGGINFYMQHARDAEIIYTIIRGVKVLVSATNTKSIDGIIHEVSGSLLDAVISMNTILDDSDVVVQQSYENLLIKLLDLDNVLKNKSLKKS